MDIPTEETEPGDAAVGGRQRPGRHAASVVLLCVIATWSVGAKACHDPESMLAPCELSIKNPTTESTYTTGERTVMLGGSVSGASFVTWVNETNGLSGEAYVTYMDWGVGSWFTDQIGLALGSNKIVVSARRNGVTAPACVRDSMNVEYLPDATGNRNE
jgi:hypothetical protein